MLVPMLSREIGGQPTWSVIHYSLQNWDTILLLLTYVKSLLIEFMALLTSVVFIVFSRLELLEWLLECFYWKEVSVNELLELMERLKRLLILLHNWYPSQWLLQDYILSWVHWNCWNLLILLRWNPLFSSLEHHLNDFVATELSRCHT